MYPLILWELSGHNLRPPATDSYKSNDSHYTRHDVVQDNRGKTPLILNLNT